MRPSRASFEVGGAREVPAAMTVPSEPVTESVTYRNVLRGVAGRSHSCPYGVGNLQGSFGIELVLLRVARSSSREWPRSRRNAVPPDDDRQIVNLPFVLEWSELS